jgi:ABC-type bacteriocin/lantibiotic exporter with double-glycine peptidase domain
MITRSREATEAWKGVLGMDQKCVVLLLGETGSGKSTFAKLVTGELSIRISHGLEPGNHHSPNCLSMALLR